MSRNALRSPTTVLDGDDIEARQDLDDRAEVPEIPFGRVIRGGSPFPGEGAKSPAVPTDNQQIFSILLGWHGLILGCIEAG